MATIVEIPGHGEVEFPDGMSEADITAAIQKIAKPAPNSGRVALNAANKGIAAVPDALLNTPANVINLGKAAFGTAAIALGRPDLAPDVSGPPDLVKSGFKKLGFIRDEAEPVTAKQRVLDAIIQGGVTAAMSPASSTRQLATNAATGSLTGAAGQGVTEVTGSPTAGMIASLSVPLAAQRARQKIAEAQELKRANAIKDETAQKAREAGYVIPPSTTNPSFVNKRLESIAGKEATGQEAAFKNQLNTNKLAAKELGLPADTAIDDSVLEAFRQKNYKPYQEIAAISPRASSALERLKETRADANLYYKSYETNPHPNDLKMAESLSKKADTIEAALEKIASRSGAPGLVDSLREARKNIAKSYDIERSLNKGTGDIEAPPLGKAFDKGKVTGNLEEIGRFQQAFPASARAGAKVPTAGVSKSEAIIGALLGTAGGAALGPSGAALAALPLVSGPTRSMILSPAYQRIMGKPSYTGGTVNQIMSRVAKGTPEEEIVRALLVAQGVQE